MLERKTTEARLRYRASMGTSAHFDPVSQPPPSLDRLKSRKSFSLGTGRVDPASFIRTTRPEDGAAGAVSMSRERAHKTNFEGGMRMQPSVQSTQKERRVSLIDPPKAATSKEEVSQRGKRIARSNETCVTNDSIPQNLSMTSLSASGVTNNNSLTMSSLISPQPKGGVRSSLTATSDVSTTPLKTHIRVNVEARQANNMDACNIAPPRKNSRWSRKKSIELNKAALTQMASPKRYGFTKPPKEPPLVTGHGVAPTNHHRRNFQMVVSARQATSPPWATD